MEKKNKFKFLGFAKSFREYFTGDQIMRLDKAWEEDESWVLSGER